LRRIPIAQRANEDGRVHGYLQDTVLTIHEANNPRWGKSLRFTTVKPPDEALGPKPADLPERELVEAKGAGGG